MSELNNNENYNDRLIYLTNEVDKLTISNNDNNKSFLPKNINYTSITMISLPIIIAIILIVLKPNFVKTKIKGKEDVKRISYIRIIIITAVLYVIEFLIKFFLIDKNALKPKKVP
jgi:hypothetical protein